MSDYFPVPTTEQLYYGIDSPKKCQEIRISIALISCLSLTLRLRKAFTDSCSHLDKHIQVFCWRKDCGRFEYVPGGQECYLFTHDARYVQPLHADVGTVGGFPFCGDNCFDYGDGISNLLVGDIRGVESAEDCQA